MDALRKLELIMQQLSDFGPQAKNSERLNIALNQAKKLSLELGKREAVVKIRVQDAEDEYLKYVALLNINPQLKHDELSYRQYKYIAIAPLLLQSEYPLLHFLQLLLQPSTLNQKALLNFLINYNLNYNLIDPQLLAKVKQLVLKMFRVLKAQPRIRAAFYPLNERELLFSDHPPPNVLKYLLTKTKNDNPDIIAEVNDFFNLGLGDIYAAFMFEYFTTLLINYAKNKDIIYDQLLTNLSLNRIILSKIVSDLILIVRNNMIVDKSILISKVMNLRRDGEALFGDPRLRSDQWELVDKTAVQTFRSWLNHKNIEFFFGVIFENRDTASDRRDFWLQYVNYIVDIKFFISEAHKRKSIIKFNEAREEMGLNFGSTDTDASLFIMEFEHFYIIEASTSRALALRIYSKKKQFGSSRPGLINASVKMSDIIRRPRALLNTFRNDAAEDVTSEARAAHIDVNKIHAFKVAHSAYIWRKVVAEFLKSYGIRAER